MKEAGKCEDKKVVKKCMKTCEKCEDHGGEGNIFFAYCTKIFFCKCYKNILGGKCKDKMGKKKCTKMMEAGKCEDEKVAKKCMKTCDMCEDEGPKKSMYYI